MLLPSRRMSVLPLDRNNRTAAEEAIRRDSARQNCFVGNWASVWSIHWIVTTLIAIQLPMQAINLSGREA
jgi:hypothetical protein